MAHQLDKIGEAHRYETARHCSYYLRRDDDRILIWRWCYIASPIEARNLQAMVQALGCPLDGHTAARIFEQATRRSVGNPRPPGMEFHALDFSDYRGVTAGNHSLAGV